MRLSHAICLPFQSITTDFTTKGDDIASNTAYKGDRSPEDIIELRLTDLHNQLLNIPGDTPLFSAKLKELYDFVIAVNPSFKMNLFATNRDEMKKIREHAVRDVLSCNKPNDGIYMLRLQQLMFQTHRLMPWHLDRSQNEHLRGAPVYGHGIRGALVEARKRLFFDDVAVRNVPITPDDKKSTVNPEDRNEKDKKRAKQTNYE